VIDHYRRSRPQVNIDDLDHEILGEKETQGELLDAKIGLDAMLEAIFRLRGVEQDVLIMRFVEDLTHQEIAKAIGKSEGATKVIQHRALKNLKKLMET